MTDPCGTRLWQKMALEKSMSEEQERIKQLEAKLKQAQGEFVRVGIQQENEIVELQTENERLRKVMSELAEQMMEKYEMWDSEEGATALGWHEIITSTLAEGEIK